RHERTHMAEYTAWKSLPPGRNVYILNFRHPLRKDAKGKLGLKVRRSLMTTVEADADLLLVQMNELLSDKNLHSILKRQEAERRGFSPIVVAAFFDPLETAATAPITIREAKIPLPKNGIPKVLFTGVTGSGKTSLLRHLMGSHPRSDRFRSTS